MHTRARTAGGRLALGVLGGRDEGAEAALRVDGVLLAPERTLDDLAHLKVLAQLLRVVGHEAVALRVPHPRALVAGAVAVDEELHLLRRFLVRRVLAGDLSARGADKVSSAGKTG